MGYMSFSEYAAKVEKQPKPKVQVVADYDGPSPAAPSLGKTPEGSGGKGQQGKVNPYKGGKDAKDPNKAHAEKGLAHHGDKKLSVMPAVKHDASVSQKELGSYPNIKTQEWIDQNRDLSLADFTKKIRDQRLSGVKNAGKAYTNIKEAVSVCKNNGSYIADLVQELKRQDLFETFLSVMVQQSEAFPIVADLMENNEGFAKKLSVALDEMVAPPMGDHEDMEEGEEDEDHHHHHHDEDEHEDEHEDEDEDHEHMDDDDHEDHEHMGDDEDHEHMDDDDMEASKKLPAHLEPMKNNPMMMKMMGYM